MGEPSETKWVGIRPTDPAEDIPVTFDGELITPGLPAGANLFYDDGEAYDSQVSFHTVTAGRTVYITQAVHTIINYGVTPGNAQFYWANNAGTTQQVFSVLWANALESRSIVLPFVIPSAIPENHKLRVISDDEFILSAASVMGYWL